MPESEFFWMRIQVHDNNNTEDLTCTLKGYDIDSVAYDSESVDTDGENGSYLDLEIEYGLPSPFGFDDGRWFFECTIPDDEQNLSGIYSYFISQPDP
jgi:hypothetical protein